MSHTSRSNSTCPLQMFGQILALMLLLLSVSSGEVEEWDKEFPTFRVIRNPDCLNNTKCPTNETKLVQVIASHPNKTIHFLLPGSNPDAPISIVMLEGEAKPDKLHVDWARFLSRNETILNSISLNGVRTSYGVMFYQFCVYSDQEDDATLSPDDFHDQCKHMLGKNILWQLRDTDKGADPLNFVYTAVNSSDSYDGLGNVTISLSFPRNDTQFSQKDVFSLTPGDGVYFEITIDSVRVPGRGRIAPILLPFSQDPLLLNEDFVETHSLSKNGKESLVNLHLAQRQLLRHFPNPNVVERAPRVAGHTPAFTQWTTTCEVSEDGVAKRRLTTLPRMQVYANMARKYRYSLPFAIYGDAFNQKNNPDDVNTAVGTRIQPLVLGTPHDGFYSATNFVRWRGVLSMGEPEERADKHRQSLLAGGIAFLLMFILMLTATVGVLIYRRRQYVSRGGQEEPLLPQDDNITHRSAIRLSCLRNRLCLQRRVPSPPYDSESPLNI